MKKGGMELNHAVVGGVYLITAHALRDPSQRILLAVILERSEESRGGCLLEDDNAGRGLEFRHARRAGACH